MSAHAKARHIEVKVVFGNEKPKIFLVSNDSLGDVRRRVMEVFRAAEDDEERVPAEKIFPELADPVMRPASALRAARISADLTQTQLAKKIGCEQADISKMEAGKISIGKARAKKLSIALKIGYRVFL